MTLSIYVNIHYLMTAMFIMGSYFSYLIARAMSRTVMQVESILSHLSGGKEGDFPYPQTGAESDFPTTRQVMQAPLAITSDSNPNVAAFISLFEK